MKLTNKQLYEYGRKLHSDPNSDYWKPAEFVRNYEHARLEWLKDLAPKIEWDESSRRSAEPFIAQPHNFGTVNRVSLAALINTLVAITMVHGDWKFECNGRVTTRTLAIPPRGMEKLIPALVDFTEQPVDSDPVYIEEREGDYMYLRILSQTVPENLTLHYLKQPKPFDLIGSPDSATEEGYTQQLEILAKALEIRETTSENWTKVQALSAQRNN